MKKSFLSSCLILMLARLTSAQSQTYENTGNLIAPTQNDYPVVDAYNFINDGGATFSITLNSSSTGSGGVNANAAFFTSSISPFDFSDVQTYTNRGLMSCDTGFIFDNAPATSGFRYMANTFGNANTGVIFAGSASNSILSSLPVFFTTSPILNITASNVVNTGVLDAGKNGFVTMQGYNLNLARGTVHVEGFDDTNVFVALGTLTGFQDRYWGIGLQTNVFQIAPGVSNFLGIVNTPTNLSLRDGNLALPYPYSPGSDISTAQFRSNVVTVATVPTGVAYANFLQVPPGNISNNLTQVVYVNNNPNGVTTDVRFEGGDGSFNGFAIPVIQWAAVVTNYLGALGQSITTNYLYLSDEYGFFPTNYLVTNLNFTLSGAPQPSPYNFNFSWAFPGYTNLPVGNTNFDAGLYNSLRETNAYAAYGVQVAPLTSFPDPLLPGSTITNTPGRIQITATNSLDLTRSHITGPNYLNLTSTNHFVGSSQAQIISPYMDINLGTTNGILMITNLVAPTIPRFTGPIDMYAARWTNVVNGVTNAYHVLIVNAALAPVSVPLVLNAKLRSTNVYVSDALNVNQTLLVNAKNLTVTSNGPTAPTPYGELALLSGDILWSSSLPVLQNLTNFGLISTLNATYFYNTPQTPYYPVPTNTPYASMVNHGLIATYGDSIWANYFENTGYGAVITNSPYGVAGLTTTPNRSAVLYSGSGPINLQATTALMYNGALVAGGDINLTNASLTVSNHDLLASGELTLTVPAFLSDGGTPSSFWSVGDGMNLPVKPASGSGLLGTTITNIAPPGVEVDNIWAASDAGANPGGFANNAAVGHLILNGGDASSQFYFAGPGDPNTGSYAIYVDELELQNGATNRAVNNGVQIFTAFDIAPNFTIYYADATMNGADISEKLNGNVVGGRCIWVPSYAGTFSSTSLVYPAGVTNTFNKALVMSTDIDSNGNGIPNAYDPTPIYTPSYVGLKVGTTNVSGTSPLIRWAGLANSTNFLYYKSNLTAANWTLVTNFVQGPSNGTITLVDRARATNRMGYYKVQVNAHQP